MAKTIYLKYDGKCADCGAHLAVGTAAKYYGRGRVYGLTCHPKPNGFKGRKTRQEEPINGQEQITGPCEDAPCCGCCGPGTGGYGDYLMDLSEPPEPVNWDDRY